METIRVGLVGADAAGKGWGATAHVPALAAATGIELAAVCTRSPESARAASGRFDVPGFHEVAEMAAQPDIDLVAVVVKVPGHAAAVRAALGAGKHVFCEWPLALDTDEARGLAEAAVAAGVRTAVGLQGRHTPELNTVRALIDGGFAGEILSVDMRWLTGGPPRGDDAGGVPGASMFAVGGGHTLDVLEHAVGAMETMTAQTDSTTGNPASIRDVLAHGRLANGGYFSYRMTVVPHHASGWTLEVRGTEGTISATTPVMPQITPVELFGAKGDEALEPIPIAAEHAAAPHAPVGPARNIAEAYTRLAHCIHTGTRFRADFADAVRLHSRLDEVAGP